MNRIEVDNLTVGLFPDQPAYELPPNAMTDARGVRFLDGSAEKAKGYSAVFGALSATGIWAASINDGTNVFWVYADETVVYATDGATHTSITSASFSASLDLGYNGGPYNGYMVVNDGTSAPQTWVPSLGNTLTELVNWPADLVCEVVRPFRQYLIALRCTEAGDYNPRLIRWGSSAQPGGLPASWDFADPANDSGRNELGQTDDLLVDCLPLRDVNIVYKEQHTWLMQFIGGSGTFDFRQIFSQAGLLAEDCVQPFGSRHFVVTDSDVMVHDGNEAQSVINGRMRRWLFNRIDSDNFKRSFVAVDTREREMVFAFPEQGSQYPNLALVWSWQENNLTVREFGREVTYGKRGVIITGATPTTFDTAAGDYAGAIRAYNEENFSPQNNYVLMLSASEPAAYQLGSGDDYAGSAPLVYVERDDQPLLKDVRRWKTVYRVYPRVEGTIGDTIDVYIGSREALQDSVSFAGPFPFTVGVDRWIDCRISGVVFSFKFEYSGVNTFKLHGYGIDFVPRGYR